jgi:hypothetical protein
MPRGSRSGGPRIPLNMQAKMRACEAAAWNHSGTAGKLWEAGQALKNARLWADRLARPPPALVCPHFFRALVGPQGILRALFVFAAVPAA